MELRNNDNKISGIPYMLDVSCDVRLFIPDLPQLWIKHSDKVYSGKFYQLNIRYSIENG